MTDLSAKQGDGESTQVLGGCGTVGKGIQGSQLEGPKRQLKMEVGVGRRVGLNA